MTGMLPEVLFWRLMVEEALTNTAYVVLPFHLSPICGFSEVLERAQVRKIWVSDCDAEAAWRT